MIRVQLEIEHPSNVQRKNSITLAEHLDFLFDPNLTYSLLFSKKAIGDARDSWDLVIKADTYEDEYELIVTYEKELDSHFDPVRQQVDSEKVFQLLFHYFFYKKGDVVSWPFLKEFDSTANWFCLKEDERFLYVIDLASKHYGCYRVRRNQVEEKWSFVGSLNAYLEDAQKR